MDNLFRRREMRIDDVKGKEDTREKREKEEEGGEKRKRRKQDSTGPRTCPCG